MRQRNRSGQAAVKALGNAAIWYAADGYDPAGKGINGRRVAGESFLRGFLAHGVMDEVVAVAHAAGLFFAGYPTQLGPQPGRRYRLRLPRRRWARLSVSSCAITALKSGPSRIRILSCACMSSWWPPDRRAWRPAPWLKSAACPSATLCGCCFGC